MIRCIPTTVMLIVTICLAPLPGLCGGSAETKPAAQTEDLESGDAQTAGTQTTDKTAIETARLPIDIERYDTAVFISSTPMNAGVIVEGKPLGATTPVLIRGLEPGRYDATLVKIGFESIEFRIVLEADEVLKFEAVLPRQDISPIFPEETAILYNGRMIRTAIDRISLPEGGYLLYKAGEVVAVEPVFPAEGALKAMGVALPLWLAFSAFATVYDLVHPPALGFPLSPVTMGSYVVTGAALTAEIGLAVQRHRYMNAFPERIIPVQRPESDAERLFENGNELLGRGNLQSAMSVFTEIVEEFPESPYMPHALYKISKIHFIAGEHDLAEMEMLLIFREYPLPDLYDKTCKGLADLYAAGGNADAAVSFLDRMLYLDPLYSREEIEEYRSGIETADTKQENRS